MDGTIQKPYAKHLKDGMTFIEIVIVLAIIAIMATVVVPNLMSYVNSSKKSTAKSTIQALQGAINMFNVHTGRYPVSLNELVKKPTDERISKKWEGPYIKQKEIPLDPWGERYVYKVTPQAEHPYELYSYGPDGRGAPKSEWINVWDL
ncbi:MAG TPA: type II secretion system major pseudopilin GspG [Patescibacteria group bacterium]|jgi:general secretion pathway protein G|nr:type II secretion system major pseudopilin GspG [Patescibacteria group bacterium]